MKYTIPIALFFVIISGCKLSKTYKPDEKRFYVFNNTYSSSDSLYFQNYVLYAIARKGELVAEDTRVRLNSDSLIKVFKNSISQLKEVRMNIDTSTPLLNRVNSSYFSNPEFRYKLYDKDYIISLANKEKDVISFVPVVGLLYDTFRSASLGAGADTYPMLICHLSIAVFIIKNEEILYYKQMRYVESVDGEFHPYAYHDFNIPIPQEHWDGLVREVMKEYIERLE